MAADYLAHYGIKRRSGRYPYGSGDDPYQHEAWHFLNDANRLKEQGFTESEIAKYFGMTARELRAEKSNALVVMRQTLRNHAISMYDQGMSYSEIGRKLGKNESVIRNILKNAVSAKEEALTNTIDVLKKQVDEHKYVDVGDGVATSMGVNETRFDAALQNLKDRGYTLVNIYVPQASDPSQSTTVRVLAQPGVTRKDILQERDKISLINEKFVDQTGKNVYGLEPIKSISSDKVMINYAEDGGKDKDGVIEIRRGAEGLDLGNAMYAQVRISVDGTHFLKGMAVYADDLPKGVDIRFNTNKHVGTPKLDCLKKYKDDPDNPFGAQIKKGGQRGYLNIVSEETDWGDWSKTLASQMLSKQPYKLVKKQLGLSLAEFEQEYKEINAYNNPTVREHLLNQFADKCETAAVDLKAAAMPRQAAYVILPVPSLKDNEIYAPKFRDGEKVVLIRYPHAGQFEIPELTVRNSNKEGRKVLGLADDAVGINPKTAAQLSGADFDGDTVVVIPNNSKEIKTSSAREELLNFEPKEMYKPTSATKIINGKKWNDPDAKTISEDCKQREMGVVSNLITDMTLKGAPFSHIVRAVKYSMVVIDAEKHGLDYKQAAIDNNINELKRIYQKHDTDDGYGGASTLISRAGSELHVPKITREHKPDPETGALGYRATGKTWTDKEGNVHQYMSTIERMRMVDDANELSSGTTIETAYAAYANALKDMAKKARLDAMSVTHVKYSPTAKKEYADEVTSINAKIAKAEAHAPVERKAQLIANMELQRKRQEDPDLTKKQRQKILTQSLTHAREMLGGSRPKIDITDREWEAIQKGAITKSSLRKVLKYADPDRIKALALPKEKYGLTPGQLALIKARLAAGYTQAQIADILGISASTVSRAVRGA